MDKEIKKRRKLSKNQMVTLSRAFRLLQTGAATGEKLSREAMKDETAVQLLVDQVLAIKQLTLEMEKGIGEYLAASDLLDHIEKVSREQCPIHLRLVKG